MSIEGVPKADRRAPRPSPGDPRLRVVLFLLLGGLLIYASFNDGPSHAVKEARLDRGTRVDGAAATGRLALLTSEHRNALEGAGPIVIAASQAVRIADLSAPGTFHCAVGLSVSNNSGEDVSDLEFGIKYSGGGAGGGSLQTVAIRASDTQAITPVAATAGGCEGLTGQVKVYRCTRSDGRDCAGAVTVPPDGAIPLSAAS